MLNSYSLGNIRVDFEKGGVREMPEDTGMGRVNPAGSLPKKEKATARGRNLEGFTDEELAAMRERARELRAGKGNDEGTVLAKIAEMPEPDRSMAERIHALVRAAAPELTARLWYGMPAYARGGKVICYFQNASKFKTRYSTLGFTDSARLDEGDMWPVAFALKELTADGEAAIAALVKKALG
jgi:uncharacterized protein YdhG (YjbR/CyaY superfamily)